MMNTIEKFIAETQLEGAFSRFKNKTKCFNQLSLEEEFLIWNYTINGYDYLNSALRNNRVSEYYSYYEQYLNNGLDKLPCYLGMSYRGRKDVSDVEFEEYKTAHENKCSITILCFYSSTREPDLARKDFARSPNKLHRKVIFHIDGKAGRNIERISNDPDEKEILFKSKSSFLITDIYEGKNFTDIYLDEI